MSQSDPSSSPTTTSAFFQFPLPSWKDFIAGTVAGVAITLVGHPFDTIKVRLQTQDLIPSSAATLRRNAAEFEKRSLFQRRLRSMDDKRTYRGGLDCFVRTVKQEGFFALYKGMSGPIVTVPVVNAIVFAAYEQGQAFFRAQHEEIPREDQLRPTSVLGSLDDEIELTMGEISLAGGWAGLVNSFIVGPVELVKSRLQTQYAVKGSTGVLFKGPFDVIRHVHSTDGVRGLCRGMNVTIAREIPAYTAQFYVYEGLKRAFTPDGRSPRDLGPIPLMLAGGFAGIAAWIVSYPQDILKSRIQVQPHAYPKHNWLRFDGGMVSCAKSLWRERGWRGFWVGFCPCVVRALPANAVGFLAYETASKFLKDDDE